MRPIAKHMVPALAGALCAAAAQSAWAQDSGPGIAFDGYVELEYVFDDDDDETFGNADVTMSVAPGTLGASWLGFDAALRVIADEDDTFSALYGSVAAYTEFGKFSIGVPRPVIADMIDLPSIGGIRFLDFELEAVAGSVTEFVYLGDNVDAPLGIRYDNSFGPLSLGASYHHLDDGGDDVDTVNLAARYSLQAVDLFASYEWIDTGTADIDGFILGAEGQWGMFGGGAAFFSSEVGGDGEGGQIWATYSPLETLDLTATYFDFESTEIWGLSADYTFWEGAYVQVGAADLEGTELYDISLGWRF